MRAITVSGWGGPEVLREVDLPLPVPGPTEILVEVHAAGVNPTDWKARATGGRGQWGDPPILGYDVSGVVAACGLGASLYDIGDEVFGMPHFPAQAGAYAEYVTAPSRQFAPKPSVLDHVEAAALPLVGLTAWQGLVEVARVKPGDRVLIHAAAGGLGHVAVQVAKALGAHVIGTASSGKHELLRRLGADELIDYREADFVAAAGAGTVDVAFDTIGGDYGERTLRTVHDGGVLVSLLPSADEAAAARLAADAEKRGVRTGWTLVEPDRHGLLAISELVERGALRPEVAHVFRLADAAEAHQRGESGHTTGKLVLRVR
jgi:NADPH:quinone reductase-like Zn-dependent oxidoreductase